MTHESICTGCTSLGDKGGCIRSITPLQRTERVPECFVAAPESMAALYFDGAQEGYAAADIAIANMAGNGFANEWPLFVALNSGVGPHVTDLSHEGLHHLAGFLAGAANRLREVLAFSQAEPVSNQKEQDHDAHHHPA